MPLARLDATCDFKSESYSSLVVEEGAVRGAVIYYELLMVYNLIYLLQKAVLVDCLYSVGI